MRINAILSEYLNGLEERGKRTRYAVSHLEDFFGQLYEVTLSDLTGYVRSRLQSAAPGTVRYELGVLRAACRSHGITLPKLPLPPEPAPKDRVLSPAEYQLLIDAASQTPPFIADGHGRVYYFIQIAMNTGARKSAIEKLTWSQVDLEHGNINFLPAGECQTKKRRPIVPISAELEIILEELYKHRETEHVLGHPGNTRKSFETACKRAGLSDVTPHTLRHTWATWACRAGVPLWEIAGILGDDEQTVSKRYAHHSPDYLRKAVNFRRES